MAFPKFDPAKHPHGLHGHFAPTGGAAAIFGMGVAKARMHLAAKKPMAPLPASMRGRAGAKATPSGRLHEIAQDHGLLGAAGRRHIRPAAVELKPPSTVSPRARARAAEIMAGGPRTPAQHVDALGSMKPEQARQYVEALKGKELDAVIRTVPGARRSGTVAQKRESLLHATGAPASAANVMNAGKPAASRMTGTRTRSGLAHSPEETAARLKTLSSDDAKQHLAKATRADLTAVADAAGVHYQKNSTKPQLLQQIVQRTAGARETHQAIARVDLGTAYGKSGGPAARMSTEPLKPNTWGGLAAPGAIHFHEDGAIGRAIQQMGGDKHLEVEGHALANVLGRIATDTAIGRVSAQDQVAQLKKVRDQLPEGSAGRRAVANAVEHLDAPHSPVPQLPEGTPAPLQQLAADLTAVPLARQDPRELTALRQIAEQFAAGRTGGLQMVNEVRRLREHRHESQEGRFDIARAVAKAAAALEEMRRTDRKSLYPPSQR